MSEDGARNSCSVAERLYEAFGNGDIDGVMTLLDPGIVWELVGPADIPYFGRYEGVAEVRKFFEVLGAHCEVERFEVRRITETEAGAVAEGFERGRFSGHRDGYEMRWCHVMTTSVGGQITSFTDYLDTAPMLVAWRT